MAFCQNCGSEVSNEAFVCTKCGVLIKPVNQKSQKVDQQTSSGFHHTASFWLLFIAGIFTAASILFFNLSIYGMGIYVGYSIIYLYLDYSMSIFAFISSCLVLVLTVLSYSLSFAPLKKGEISKSTNYILLLLLISSVIYAFAKLCMIM